jgi:hypothetical protein
MLRFHPAQRCSDPRALRTVPHSPFPRTLRTMTNVGAVVSELESLASSMRTQSAMSSDEHALDTLRNAQTATIAATIGTLRDYTAEDHHAMTAAASDAHDAFADHCQLILNASNSRVIATPAKRTRGVKGSSIKTAHNESEQTITTLKYLTRKDYAQINDKSIQAQY